MADWHRALGAGLGFYMGGPAGALVGYFFGKFIGTRRNVSSGDLSLNRYYEALKISPTAKAEEIKQSYRTLVKKYHPDLNGHVDEKTASMLKKKMSAINEAYSEIRKVRNF